jgi:hypothetical protein
MTQTSAADLAPRLAAALVRHPAVAAARVAAAAVDGGPFLARVVPAANSGRFAASGRCALIDASGAQRDGELLDIAWTGIRARVAGAEQLEVDAEVQLWIESEALGGGVEGWLGRVRWIQGEEVGVAFAGNFDEGAPLVRLVQAFAAAGGGQIPRAPAVDERTRVAVIRQARLHVGTLAIEGRTRDLSLGGVGFEADELTHLDLRSRDLRICILSEAFGPEGIRGTAVRHDGTFVGVELLPTESQQRSLRAVMEGAVMRATVSTAALAAWLRGHGLSQSVEVRYVDELADAS